MPGLSIPILSCSLAEPELKLIGETASVGCITSSAYFESIDGAGEPRFCRAVEGAAWRRQHPVGRRAVDLCLRHAAGARDPPRRLRRRQRRAARRGQSPLPVSARPDLGRSRQQSLLPHAAPGALRAWRANSGFSGKRTRRSVPTPICRTSTWRRSRKPKRASEMNRAMKRKMKRASHLRVVK